MRENPSFAELPFAEQLAHLDARVAAGEDLPALLAEAASLADHQPLAELVGRLLDAGLLGGDEALGLALGGILRRLPGTGIQRLLRTLAEVTRGRRRGMEPGEVSEPRSVWERASELQRGHFIALVAETIPALPVERVAAVCLLDRWLKNEAREVRDAIARAAEEEVAAAIAEGAEAITALGDAALLALPTGSLASVAAAAAAGGCDEIWRARRQRFAATVLQVLEAQPKSLSQANAEELLARRVYTDPGHFFVELLQNADDARATRWHVTVADDRVEVWHDGAPFDAKDVVGVLSIGQTTKSNDQIGLFGVGFKSVYEICERPQIFSPPFCFEIADVSIPRRLACRSMREANAAEEPEGTRLVLPFRGGADKVRGEALLAKALAVAPQTLLTLRAIRELVVEGPASARHARAEEMGDGRVALQIEERRREEGAPTEGVPSRSPSVVSATRYLVARRAFPRPTREHATAPPAAAEILVAVELDEDGRPRPLAPSTPTVFAFLPTGERSGLRVLLHAPFELPVDRERLDTTTPRNRWALERAGELLASLVARWAREGEARHDEADARGGASSGLGTHGSGEGHFRAMLSVLPLARELAHPGYEVLVATLASALGEVPCLPAAGGGAISPARARLCEDDALAAVLARVTLDAAGGRALSLLSSRERALAEALGARRFDVAALVSLLEETLVDHLAGAQSDEPWLRGELLDELLSALARLLDATARDLRVSLIARLAALPLWPDTRGGLHRASALARGPRRLRALYGRSRSLLAPHLDPPAERPLRELLDALAVEPLDDARLLEDLGDETSTARLFEDAMDTDGARQRSLALLEALLALSPHERRDPRIPRARAFVAVDGRFCPLVGADALLLGSGDALEAWLRGVAAPDAGLHLCDPILQADYGSALVELGAERLTLEGLLTRLCDDDLSLAASLDREAWRALHRLLLGARDELPRRAIASLVAAPIFFDREGRRRPLAGSDAALLPADAAIIALAPGAPWLEDDGPLRALAASLVEAQGAPRVARTLLLDDDGTEPLFDPLDDPGALRRAYHYLSEHHASLTEALRRRLTAAPIWLDSADRLSHLEGLRRPVSSDPAGRELVFLYRAWDACPASLVDPDALALAEALGVAEEIPRADHAQWIRDLARAEALTPLLGATYRPELIASLEVAAARLDPRALEPLRDVPLFADEEGVARRLGSWRERLRGEPGRGEQAAPSRDHAYLVAEPYRPLLRLGSLPLVAVDVVRELSAVLACLGEPFAELDEALACLEGDPRLATGEAAAAARARLVTLAVAGGEEAAKLETRRDLLARLRLWPGAEGALHCAGEVIDPVGAAVALGDDWEELLSDPLSLADEVRDEAAALAPFFVFRDPLEPLLGRLRVEARVGAPLSEQPAFLRSPGRLLDFLEIVTRHAPGASEGGDAEDDALTVLPLLIDASGRLARAPLHRVTEDEAALLAGDDLAGSLCDLAFGDAAAARIDASTWERLAPPLSLRRLLTALADHCREARPARTCEVPPLSKEEVRGALYRVLLRSADVIAADDQARGVLGRAHLLIDRGGVLRSPRELLLISPRLALPTLEDLEARPAEEIPAALLAWVGATYAHDAYQVERVMDHLLAAYDETVEARDEKSAIVLLETMAQTLRAGRSAEDPEDPEVSSLREAIAALPTRIKLHRTLRVPSADGAWVRPRALLLATAREASLFVRLFGDPPPIPSADVMTAPLARALLEAIGAHRSLDDEHLMTLLTEEDARFAEDPGAAHARAFVLLRALEEEPARLTRLGLDRRAWLPDGEGHLRAPCDLYWPDVATRSLLGEDPARYLSDELRFALSEALIARLPFRHAEEARLEDVVEAIRTRPPASVDQLCWLEAGLRARRLDAAALRAELAASPCLRDDLGETRAPLHLCKRHAVETFGRRRGDFTEGRRYRRVSAALGIPSRPGPRQAAAFLGEIAALLDDDAAATRLLDAEPELLETLPKAFGIWARRPPRELPPRDDVAIAARRHEDAELLLCRASDPRFDLTRSRADALSPLWPDEDEAAARALWDRLQRQGAKEVSPTDRMTRGARGVVPPESRRSSGSARVPREGAREGDAAPVDGAPAATEGETETEGLVTRLKRWWRRSPPMPADDASSVALAAPPPEESPARGEEEARPETRAERRRRQRAERRRQREAERLRRELRDARAREEAAARAREEDRAREREAREAKSASRRGERRAPSRRRAPTPRRDETLRPLGAAGGVARRGGRGRPSPGEAPPEERQWFRPRESIDEQFSDHSASLADRGRAPIFGFAHAPRQLPPPWLYAPRTISGRFDVGAQRWLPLALPPSLFASEGAAQGSDASAGEVEVTGRVPAGEILLPVPAFAHIASIRGEGALHQKPTADGRMLLFVDEPQEIAYRLVLEHAPAFDVGSPVSFKVPSAELLAVTTDEDDLPGEILDVVDAARADLAMLRRSPFDVALELRDLVRARYRYDPSYLEDPQVARWLRSLVLGRKNMHIAALHAGRDAHHLGRGVCYELNALLTELLRRAGIPSAVASGWTFDRGNLAEPDHLWALALLPTPSGLRFCPLDASSTREGRPLHAQRRPRGRWKKPDRGRSPRAPTWHQDSPTGRRQVVPSSARSETASETTTRSAPRRGEGRGTRHDVSLDLNAEKLAELLRFLDGGSARGADAEARLTRALQLLADPAFVEALTRLVEGS